MLRVKPSSVRNFMHGTAWSLYHILVVALSGGIALSLPTVARSFLTHWSLVENEKIYLVAVEMTAAIFLIVSFNYLHRSLRDRALAKMATGAGLTAFSPWRKLSDQRKIKKLKEEQGAGRNIMAIGSTGYGTFVDQEGDLYRVLEKCMGAHILLVNPYSQEATSRIDAILNPHFTREKFRKEVWESITLLKRLKATGKAVKLKLYSDPPLVKLAMLGDYIWLKHYYTDLDMQTMPEYLFQHNLKDHGLYNLFHQYLMQRWDNPEIPEYDFDTDELVYRGHNGTEVIRQRFGMGNEAEELRQEQGVLP